MSYETEAHGQVKIVSGPLDITVVDEDDWEEPSVDVRVGDKVSATEDGEGHISLTLAVEDQEDNWGQARVSFNPDEARELGEALVEEADGEMSSLFADGFIDMDREEE